MNKEKQKIVPELRFPEFRNNKGWKIEPLNDVYSFKITNSFSRDKLNYEKGTVKNIHYGDIHTKFSTHFDITKEKVPYINPDISIDRIDKDNYCEEGDLVIADASEDMDDIGKSIEIINLNNEKLLAGLHTFLARPIDSKITTGFGGHLFKSNGLRIQIKKEAQGAKVLGISKGRLANLDVYYPDDELEQQKIANCLSSLDNIITLEIEKLDLLKDHKKGLLQQLFPAEGETKPQFRFPEFENDGDWKKEEIEGLFRFKQGLQVPTENQFPTKEEGMVRFIRIIDITSSSEPPRFIDKPDSDHLIQQRDLFMIRYGTPGVISIGLEGVIANNLFRLIWKLNSTINSIFWFYAFQNMEKKIFSLSSSSSMPAISFSTLNNLDIQFPKNPKEQQKIANCISSADELIVKQMQKIKTLKKHKKGLMQQLFPNVNSLVI